MSTFSKTLSSQFAYDMAQVILDGFSRYYRIFREASLEAKHSFESQNWLGINELLAANIFPGNMLFKNFGVTRHGRVVFYDDDKIEYFTKCKIRNVPIPRSEEEEMSREIWYQVCPKDIFTSTYDTFLLGATRVRKYLIKHHADFYLPDTWRVIQNQFHKGSIPALFSHPKHLRFINKHLSSSIERV